MINVGLSAKVKKDIMCAKNIYAWNPPTCTCENGKYLGSINGDLVITCVENIEATETTLAKTVPTKITSKYCNKFVDITSLFMNSHNNIISC